MNTELPFAPACERNKRPILDVLARAFPAHGRVLEIGSYSGQHLVYFAPRMPGLSWQPSDQAENLPGLKARLQLEGCATITEPIELDVTRDWPQRDFDAVYSSNTAHIMSWPMVIAMYAGVGRVLKTGGVFCLYGPFNEDGRFTSDSNELFDRDLRDRDPQMGLRDIADLDTLARSHQLTRIGQHRLPANNQMLVYRKD